MATLRTMNRRRWRKENPVIEACDALRRRADGSLSTVFVGVRANRYVRFSPKPASEEIAIFLPDLEWRGDSDPIEDIREVMREMMGDAS